jgi:macrolide transport system ATP-binding/permease protein
MLKDLRYAFRTLCQKPAFALTAIVSIALAIGANSAIFSFQDAILLRPLAVENPSTLVSVNSRNTTGGYGGFPYPDVVDIREKNSSFDGLIAYRLIPAGVARDEKAQPQFKAGLLVSGNFFDLLGVRPYLGRGFRPDEDQVLGRDAVVVLSYDYWQNELGADASIIGRSIRLGHSGGLDFNVIGVAPESFTGMDLFVRPAFYIPVMMGPKVLGISDDLLKDRSAQAIENSFVIKARLRPGISPEAADKDIAALAAALEKTYPDSNRGRRATVRTEMQSRLDFNPILGGVVAAVFGLMVVILLIACANVMNLMLGRGRSRAREIAIQLSLGAGRVRLVRQLMAESLMIAVAGGALGLLLAQAAVDFFSTWELPGDAPLKLGFQLDTRVLLFTLLTSVFSAVLFGLVPAFRCTRSDLVTTLKAGESLESRRRFWGRNVLVAVQIAGSIVLVMTAASMYRNTTRLLKASPGFALDHRLTIRLDSAVAGYTLPQSEQFYRKLVDQAAQLPGIRAAALSSGLPFTTSALMLSVAPEGFELPQGQTGIAARAEIVDENYFDTFGVAILQGRGFLSSDLANSPKVAVVNQAFAERIFGGAAIGKRIRISNDDTWVEVVGVSATAKYSSVVEPPQRSMYLPFRQHLQARMTLIAQTATDPLTLASSVRELIRSLDPTIPILSVRSMDDLFQRTGTAQIDVFNAIFSSTGIMGFFLSLVGLYAVVSYQVAKRTREIGIRMAIGAERFQVMRMILKQAGIVAGIGMFIGLSLSVALRPALLASLGRPNTTTGGPLAGFDPLLFGLVPLSLMVITLVAAAIPARRASRIDPQRALRQE